jgi:hypothetical protein
LLVLPLSSWASEPAEQTVLIEVMHSEGENLSGLTAVATWLGRERMVVLTDDGAAPDMLPADEIWTAQWSGPPLHLLPVRVEAQCGDAEERKSAEIYAGLERLHGGDNLISLMITKDCDAPAVRVPSAADQTDNAELKRLGAHAGWLVLGLLGVVWAAGRFRPSPAPDSPPGRLWPWLGLWLVLAAIWTWPALQAGPEMWVGRHFDLPGTIWSISAVPRLDWALSDDLTGWPRGAKYARFVSYTLIPVAWLAQAMDPARLHGWLQLVGVALSAWAAQGFARAVGARAPWDLVAGVAFGFSGIASTSLLEGHVYQVFDPWMPLFAWAWWQATQGPGSTRQGLLAGLLFCLTLLTSAYLGMAAALIAIAFFLGGLAQHGRAVMRAGWAAAAVVLPVGLGLGLISGSSQTTLHDTTMASIQLGSTNLLNLMGPLPQIDFDGHSIAPTLSPIILGLILVAPMVKPGSRLIKVLTWTALTGLLISFGTSLDADGNSPLFVLPLYWLLEATEQRWFRFPVRIMWVWGLCGGVVAAVVLTRLARHSRWMAGLLLLGAIAHPFVAVNHTGRQHIHEGRTPSAYALADGPVLDLFPEGSDLAREEEMWFSALACAYQVGHGQPLAEDCVSTVPQENPRSLLGQMVRAQLMAGETDFVADTLGRMGFVAIAVHADLFTRGDTIRLMAALSDLDPDPIETLDGGERILLVKVPHREAAQYRSQRSALLEAASDTTFVQHKRIGASLAGAAGRGPRTLRLEVREEELQPEAMLRWTARTTWEGGEAELELMDPLERVREEEDMDLRWTALWAGDLPAHFTLGITGSNRAGDVIDQWEGQIWSQTSADRLVFLHSQDDGLRPMVATAALSTPLRQSNAGLIAASFWGLYALLGLVCWLVLRRRAAREIPLTEA